MKNYMKKESLDNPDYDKTNFNLSVIEKLEENATEEWIKDLSDKLYNEKLRTVFHITKEEVGNSDNWNS